MTISRLTKLLIVTAVLYSPLPPLRLHGLAQGVGGGELFLLHLLPRVELLVGTQEDVLVTELIHTHARLGSAKLRGVIYLTKYKCLPDDCVDATDFVGHLPGALETPNVVVTECITKIPVPKVWTFLVIWFQNVL